MDTGEIRLFPSMNPTVSINSEGQQVHEWIVEFMGSIAPQHGKYNSQLGLSQIGVDIKLLSDVSLVMTVKFDREAISYGRARDAALRAFLLLERMHGEIAKVQNVERNTWYWKMNFVFAERAGAFDTDKSELMTASATGELEKVVKILRADEAVIDELSLMGITALMYAASKGHLEVAKTLLESHADPRRCGTELTVVQSAVYGGKEMLDLILSAGGEPKKQNRYGETALMFAASCNDLEMIKMLLHEGADKSVRDARGLTAADWAAKSGNTKAIEYLNSN